jgi:hypothetical protein
MCWPCFNSSNLYTIYGKDYEDLIYKTEDYYTELYKTEFKVKGNKISKNKRFLFLISSDNTQKLRVEYTMNINTYSNKIILNTNVIHTYSV